MMTNQNCISYSCGKCLHQAAPRSIFGPALCVLEDIKDDPRIKSGCALQVEHKRPNAPSGQASPPITDTYKNGNEY